MGVKKKGGKGKEFLGGIWGKLKKLGERVWEVMEEKVKWKRGGMEGEIIGLGREEGIWGEEVWEVWGVGLGEVWGVVVGVEGERIEGVGGEVREERGMKVGKGEYVLWVGNI